MAWVAFRAAPPANPAREHRRRFAAAGREGIERLDCAGHAPVLTKAQAQALGDELQARFLRTAKQACGFVAERFSLACTPNAMAKLLGRMGAWQRPRRVPAKGPTLGPKKRFLAASSPP